MDDVVEVIGIEHLKVILSGLSPEEIIRPAYENWQTCMKTGYTRLNLETGEIYGVGVELNDLPLPSTIYIELYKIDAYDEPISEEEFFSQSLHHFRLPKCNLQKFHNLIICQLVWLLQK